MNYKKLIKKNISLVLVGLIVLAIFGGYTYYSTPSSKIASNIGLVVTYKDGTKQIFDSKTLTPGQIVKTDGGVISSITTKIIVKPVVKASDGTYPTTRPPTAIVTQGFLGLYIKENSKLIKNYDDKSFAWSWTKKDLTPNMDNIVLEDSTTLTEAALDSLTPDFTNGQTFTLQWFYPGASYPFKVKLMESGEEWTSGAASQVVGTVVLKKSISGSVITYKLESVSVTGGFT